MLLVFDEYSFDDATRELRRGAEVLKLGPQQVDLLALFLRHPGVMLSRQQILDDIWDGRVIAESVLSVAIAKLRKTLGRSQGTRDYIECRYGRGYRFLPVVTRVSQAVRSSERAPRSAKAAPPLPLVGRRAAFERLVAAAEQVREGRGLLCLLAGEAGIGKTHLAECFEQSVSARGEREMSVVWGRCQADVNSPLWAVRQILSGLAKHGLVDAREIEAVAPEQPVTSGSFEVASARLFDALKRRTEVDHGLLDALAQCIINAGRRHPLMIVVDDIQWADSASLRVLTYVADELARVRILLLCGLRTSAAMPGARRDVSKVWNHRNCQRIELQRLDLAQVAEYVSSRFASLERDGDEREAFVGTLHARSEGNPFYMIELLRSVEHAVSPITTVALAPSSLALDAMRERLQVLPLDTRRVLSAAAVIGHDFDVGLLSHVADVPPEAALTALESSLANGTVRARADELGAFCFDHELIREVLCSELQAHERGQLHLRTGHGLARRRAHGGEVAQAALAHHFLSAQPYGDLELAIAHAQTAAAEASRLAAYADARQIVQLALDVLNYRVAPPPEMRAALLLQLALVARVQGDAAYGAHLSAAVAIARERRLGHLLTLAGQQLSLSPDVLGHQEAAEVLEAARDSLAADDHEDLAIVHAQLAWMPPNCRSARKVEALLGQAQVHAERSGSIHARAAVDDSRLYFSAGLATLDQAEEIAQRIERACLRQPELASHARSMHVARFRLITAMQRGDRACAARAIEVHASLLSRLKNAELSWHHERKLLVKAMNEGAFEQVRVDLLALRERARRLELHASELLCGLDYGVLLCRTTDVGSLARRARARLQPSVHDSPQMLAGKIRRMINFGLRDDVVETMAGVSLADILDLPRDRDYLAVLSHFAAGAAVAKSRAHCEALKPLLAPYVTYFAVGVSLHCEGSCASHMGLLCEALGELDEAREHYARGLERERAFGLMPCAAQTGFRLARLLLAERVDSAEGRSLLEHVWCEAQRMGMQPLALAARSRLGT